MEMELVELFDAAKKAADAAIVTEGGNGPKIDRCVDALNQLKGFPVSYDVLVSTQVAKRLRPLTKHPEKQIQTKVADVLEIWKKIIISEAAKKKNGVEVTNSKKTEVSETKSVKVEQIRNNGSVKVEKVSKTETTVIKPGSISRSESIKVEKKTESVKKVPKEENGTPSVKRPHQVANAPPKLTSLIKCNDPIRDKMRELILDALSKVSGEVDADMRDEAGSCDPMRVSVAVESAMFEKMGRSNGAQKAKYRSIMFNLKDAKNPDFRRKVLFGQIKAERVPDISPEEMASDERQRENNQIKEKALLECERAAAPKASTDQFKCGRCGQRKCTYYQMQTRSADEPMTTFVTCVNCNNHWKFC